MKTSVSLALGGSLAANAVLLVALMVQSGDPPNLTGEGATTMRSANLASAEPVRPTAHAPTSQGTEPKDDLWRTLVSSELPVTVANLRQAGFPEAVVRAMAKELIDQRYNQRERELWNPDQPLTPFWEARGSRYNIDPETQSQLRELSRQKQQDLVALLGELPIDDRTLFYMRRRYGDLPADKLTELIQINSDYTDLTSQIRQGSFSGPMMPWDREQLAYIEQEQRADIEALLTPEELDAHDLYGSRTANSLRSKLGQFATTEHEFRELYALQKVFDDTFDFSRGPPSADVMRTRRLAQEELENKFQAVLGEDRYTEYQRFSNVDYRAASSVVEHFKLPAENAVAVYELAQDMEQRARALQTDRNLAPEQRNAQLSALAAEASTDLDNLLSSEGARAYRDSGVAGRWLNLLEARPPPPPRP